MEGTRHERVGLVTTSYIIGFVTAFIGFGVAVEWSGPKTILTAVEPATLSGSVIVSRGVEVEPNAILSAIESSDLLGSVIVSQGAETDMVQDDSTAVNLTSEGLILTTTDEEVLLSAARSTTDTAMDGVHANIPMFEISPNGQYVYFCEQPLSDVDSCKPFVYSLATATVYPITQNRQRIALPATSHTISWNMAQISIDGMLIDQLPQ